MDCDPFSWAKDGKAEEVMGVGENEKEQKMMNPMETGIYILGFSQLHGEFLQDTG
jgi:hypothetical protein